MESVTGDCQKILAEYGLERYMEGHRDGLGVAEKIVNWLSMQPDTKRQKMIRGWAEAEIQGALDKLRWMV